MGIFSLFGKKGGKKEDRSTEKSSSKNTRSKSGNSVIGGFQDSEIFSNSIIAQRHIARATERKIDAIEFEMSRDIVKTRPPAVTKFDITAPTQPLEQKHLAMDFQTTLPMALPTDYMLGQHSEMSMAAFAQSESVPVLEEAAILFASGQNQVAEQMLISAVHHQQLGNATEIAWQMLFDFYRLTNDQYKFESLSLDYANKFETSPPLWPEHANNNDAEAETHHDGTTIGVTFPSKLDAGIVKVLEKMQQSALKSPSLRLDFTRVKEVDPIGCGLLLRAIKQLKKSGHELMLVSAQAMVDKIRAILEVGRRDETEAPWLLILEILQLLHLEKAFEEVSMDYCVTFEVSPPSFEAPKNKVISSFPEIVVPEEEMSDRFKMPTVVEGKTEALIKRINEQAAHHNPLVLDCSQLERVEFGASAELMNGLAPIASKSGMTIRFEEVNYLVMMLFNAMGLKNIASISARKH
ncbi:MAG: STAS domain-containing protein [Burkholderiales bacterium]|nr:STAS domain-containing protein [Burkholderiales bacterium]